MVYSTSSSATGHYTSDAEAAISWLRSQVHSRDPEQTVFLQAFDEVLETLLPVLRENPIYCKVLAALAEPERVVKFRVNWFDDKGEIHTNRGYRVQYNSALGPYKGGLRFHPTVSESVLKFLGFEQIFKNSLTGLPMGGGKGGSDFDPKGKSDLDVRNFCTAFMTELSKHIGADTDVPAGDIGVGGREIGFLFGTYRKCRNEFVGVLTGKGASWGGSLCRPEATGYGAVYFCEKMLEDRNESLKGKRCVVSGSGNAAQYTCEKLLQLGAVVLTVSDSNGTLYFPNGMSKSQLETIMAHKNVKRGRLSQLKENFAGCEYLSDSKPWGVADCDIAFPAATQNEIEGSDAEKLHAKKCYCVVEVANMPSTNEAIAFYKKNSIMFAPGKAANAGGVAVSGMEMAQNSARLSWTFEKVDEELKKVMTNIYNDSKEAAEKYSCPGDLQAGANIAGFLKVADAMIDQGMF